MILANSTNTTHTWTGHVRRRSHLSALQTSCSLFSHEVASVHLNFSEENVQIVLLFSCFDTHYEDYETWTLVHNICTRNWPCFGNFSLLSRMKVEQSTALWKLPVSLKTMKRLVVSMNGMWKISIQTKTSIFIVLLGWRVVHAIVCKKS